MNVLFLCHRQSDAEKGGMAEFLRYLPPALKKLGVNSVLYTATKEMQLTGPILFENGLPHYNGPFLKPSGFTFSHNLKPLIQLCKEQNIQLIHAQGTYRSGFVAMKLKQSVNIPYVVTSHSDITPTNSQRMRRNSIKKRCAAILASAQAVTHLTPQMAEFSDAILETKNKSSIISNGIDLHEWQNHSPSIEKNYLLAMGRLEPEKGFSILIDAYAKICQGDTDAALVIAGSGSAEEALYRQAINTGLKVIKGDNAQEKTYPPKSIIFTGYVRDTRKFELLSQCKMMLFATQPTLWDEAFGIVLLEGLAAGKPIVGSDIYATRYLQAQGAQISLVEPHNIPAWVEKIKSLLGCAAPRQNMGHLNALAAKQFSWDIIAKRYEEVYKHCLRI